MELIEYSKDNNIKGLQNLIQKYKKDKFNVLENNLLNYVKKSIYKKN